MVEWAWKVVERDRQTADKALEVGAAAPTSLEWWGLAAEDAASRLQPSESPAL